jgi:serine protease Do
MARVSRQRGVPVIVVDGHVVVGFDRPQLERLLAQPGEGSRGIGLAVASAGAYAQKHGLHLPEGAYVGKVRPESAAMRAGIQPGDVIVGVAGQAVRGEEDLAALLHAQRGQRAPVAVWRQGQTRVVEIDL